MVKTEVQEGDEDGASSAEGDGRPTPRPPSRRKSEPSTPTPVSVRVEHHVTANVKSVCVTTTPRGDLHVHRIRVIFRQVSGRWIFKLVTLTGDRPRTKPQASSISVSYSSGTFDHVPEWIKTFVLSHNPELST